MASPVGKSVRATLVFAVLLCGAYPALIWGISALVFNEKAGGSLVVRDGKTVGSTLIGQAFTKPEYFHGRPSAAGNGYDAANSSGSNLGPTNQKLVDRISADVDKVVAENPGLAKGRVPVDLVTTSASGLDPHISVEAAEVQADRVARVRGLPPDQVRQVVKENTQGPQWGIFGESVVNVLALNLALDDLKSPAK